MISCNFVDYFRGLFSWTILVDKEIETPFCDDVSIFVSFRVFSRNLVDYFRGLSRFCSRGFCRRMRRRFLLRVGSICLGHRSC